MARIITSYNHFDRHVIKIILCIYCMFSTFAAISQHRSYFGTRVSLDLSIPREGWGFYSSGFGIQGGLVYNRPLGRNMYLEPGIEAYYADLAMKDIVADGKIYQGQTSNIGVTVPVNLGYRLLDIPNLQFAVFTGPRFNFNVFAREYITPNFEGPMPYHSIDLFEKAGWKRVDLQWGIGVTATFRHHFVIECSFGVGITPAAKYERVNLNKYRKMYRNTFALTMGYNF